MIAQKITLTQNAEAAWSRVWTEARDQAVQMWAILGSNQ